MKKILAFLIATCSLLIFFSCSQYGFFWGLFGEDDVDDRSASLSNFNSLSPDFSKQTALLPDSPKYSVLIITDLHYGSEREELDEKPVLDWLENWFKKYSGKGENPSDKDLTKIPRFAVNIGDTADGGKRDEFKLYLEFEKEIKRIANKYLYGDDDASMDYTTNDKFKIYSILGNHDLYHNGVEPFMELIFPYNSSYFFTVDSTPNDSHSGFSYYFLDTANGTTGTSQLDDFKDKIKSDGRPKIVFTHYPVYAGGTDFFMILQNTIERNTLLTYFAENNVRQVYEGHAHKNYGKDYDGKFREDVIGSLRFSSRANKQCAIFTVDEASETVTTEIIEF